MLRTTLRALGALPLFLATAAVAQPLSAGETERTAQFLPEVTASIRAAAGLSAAPAASESPSNTLVDCTNGQTINQNIANTNVSSTTSGPKFGQSFTAPCNGHLTGAGLGINVDATNTNQTWVFAVYTLVGNGPTGTVLDAVAYQFNNGATLGNFILAPLTLYEPVAVVEGQQYTLLFDIISGTGARLRYSNANPYAGGTLYTTAGADIFTMVADPASDQRIQAIFATTTTASQSVFNGAGWRLLSAPVAGVSVNDMAVLNLVQGVPTDDPGYPEQYPDALPNIFPTYDGDGTYTAPIAPYVLLTQGRGFFWYWWDQDFGPFEGGTSQSRELSTFTLTQSGPASSANIVRTVTVSADGWYLTGNPFALPLAVSGITKTAGDGTLQTTFHAWNPATSNYVPLLTSNPGAGGASDFAAVWQGLFAQVTVGTTNPTFTYAFASTSPTATPPFYGSHATVIPYVQLLLDGTTASGTEVHDVGAYVRFHEGASVAWDADDASKMMPPFGMAHALLAPMGELEGAPERLSVNTLPLETTGVVTVPVAFTATEAGSFTVTWNGAAELPEGWTATLADAATAATVDLRAQTSYTFAAAATDWTERFTLTITPSGVVAGENGPMVDGFRLGDVAPNPTAGAATLALRVEVAQLVRATLYDALGRQVAVLLEGNVAAGADAVLALDAAALAPGAYVVRVDGETFSATRRVTVVR